MTSDIKKAFDYKRIALLTILESPGSVEDKAAIVFELFSNNHTLTSSDLKCLLSDMYTIAVKQLTQLGIGDEALGFSSRTSIIDY